MSVRHNSRIVLRELIYQETGTSSFSEGGFGQSELLTSVNTRSVAGRVVEATFSRNCPHRFFFVSNACLEGFPC